MRGNQAVLRRQGQIRYWAIPAFERLGCRTAFFQRPGGVSQGTVRGLNLGLHTPDLPERVLENRTRALQAAGLHTGLVPVIGQQVHGIRLRLVTEHDAGRGWRTESSAPKNIDGLLTAVPGLPVAVTVADCLPVLFAAGSKPVRAVAAVHAGWRGVAGGILAKTVRRFHSLWRITPEHLWIAIGPGIGPEDFVIRGEALDRLGHLYPEAVKKMTLPDEAGFDLWQAATKQLLQSGVPAGHILAIRENTAAHPRKYFSFRREHETGRMLGMIQF